MPITSRRAHLACTTRTAKTANTAGPARSACKAAAALTLMLAAVAANATEAARGIEQALAAAQQDKRGITVYVAGQTIGGAVTRIEPGQWVELKNQTASKIIVRLDRIDAIAAP
jgi:endonuclease YncB( thermonuclease family)